MKRATVMTGILAATIALGGASAYAMGGNGPKGPMGPMGPGPFINFEEVDTNNDGKITKEEIAAAPKARFDAADTDKDGALNLEELQARAVEKATEMAKERAAKMLEHKDANKDGKLTMDELEAGKKDGKRGPFADKMFDRVDVDNDGAISKDEYDTAREWMKDRMGGPGKHKGGKKPWFGGKHGGGCDNKPAEQ